MFVSRSTLIEPILVAAQPAVTLQAYVGINEATRRPHNLLYTDLIVTIIMIKGCNYGILRKWLTKNQIIPSAQAYTTVSNELVDMINIRTFPLDTSKQKQTKRNKNKNNDKETVEGIIKVNKESSLNYTTPVELESVDNDELDSEESDSEESDTSSESEMPI